MLLNLDRVVGLGSRADDVLILGDIDSGVRRLASAIGWLEELEALYKALNPDQSHGGQLEQNNRSRDDILDDEIDKITREVDESLRISERHTSALRESISLPEQLVVRPDMPNDGTSVQNRSTINIRTHRAEDQGDSDDSSWQDKGADKQSDNNGEATKQNSTEPERRSNGPTDGKASL